MRLIAGLEVTVYPSIPSLRCRGTLLRPERFTPIGRLPYTKWGVSVRHEGRDLVWWVSPGSVTPISPLILLAEAAD